jgi:hypothetical protein
MPTLKEHVRELKMSRLPLLRCMILPLVIVGCATPNRSYQPAGQAELKPSKLYEDNTPYEKLCAIEFDEQGDIWKPAQISVARSLISKSARKPLLVVFIHGWHNNAHPGNGNLQSFNQLLKQLAKRANTGNTEVVGVFVGWRGLAIERQWDRTGIGWVARHLSFYSRKNDTDLVAGVPLTKTLYSLASEAHARDGQVVFIGHSFGGRVLEKAMAQAIIGQTASDSDAKAILPADLTLLINPASEAVTGRRLKLALQNWSQPSPAIISVTSVGDTDTSTWWSLGMNAALWTKSRSYRRYNDGSHQKEYVVRTAGHSPILLDRRISRLEPQPPAPEEDATKWNFQNARTSRFLSKKTWWQIQEVRSSSAPFIMNEHHARGYWVMSAPKEIIADHNDIFNESAIELFAALFKICKPTMQKSPEQKAITVPATIAELPPDSATFARR